MAHIRTTPPIAFFAGRGWTTTGVARGSGARRVLTAEEELEVWTLDAMLEGEEDPARIDGLLDARRRITHG